MPKNNKSKRNKRRGGGMFDYFTGNSSGTSSSSSSEPGWFDSLKKKASSATSSASSLWPGSTSSNTTSTYSSPTPAPAPAPVTQYPTQGGRRRRKMRGGYSDNVSTTNLASSAAPFSGSTARAQAYVGGKTKRRSHKHKGSRKRHCKK